MQRVGSSEDLLTQQSVNSHLPIPHRPVWSPGQNLIQLEGQDIFTAGTDRDSRVLMSLLV